MTDESKPYTCVWNLIVLVGSVLFLFWAIGSRAPTTNVDCIFEAKSTENPFWFGHLEQPIKSVTLTGRIDDTFETVLYDLSGTALIDAENETITSSARGKILMNEHGQIVGVLIVLKDERHDEDWLNLATLNANGVIELSEDGTPNLSGIQTYLFADQANSNEHQFTYPLTMRCGREATS